MPFCLSKCPYCDFYSSASLRQAPAVTAAMGQEMQAYRGKFAPFTSVFIGGGTPSALPGELLDALLNQIRDALPWLPGAEITAEANPDSAEPATLALLQRAGVNRLSLGLQSADDGELRYLRRRHDSRAGWRAVDAARAAGFEALSVDLIYGLPGQSLAGWEQTLRAVLAVRPEHISCYQLTIEPRTVFGQQLARGEIVEAGDEAQRLFFFRTSELLQAGGYLHYEISNFALGSGHICRHNQKYWRRAPYLGIGPAAHSFQDGRRWWNVRSSAQYLAALRAARLPVDEDEHLTADQEALERIYLGFRTLDGAPLADLRRAPGWQQALDRLEREGLVRVAGGRAIATLAGWAVADQLPLPFIGRG